MSAESGDVAAFAPRLIAWQRTHGRQHLPWQHSRDPYRIWLSEIMLQQTQVATVVPYYTRFLARFPDLASLAAAPDDTVMALWSGLGYYSRARNLLRCARVVMAEHGGAFPREPAALAALPGIGRSTAAAIAAFAFGARVPILDGNVKRVLARVFGIEGVTSEKAVENAMWALAETLLPADRPERAAQDADMASYTQGLMDLGATVCVRGKPSCGACPFNTACVAHATGREKLLPTARPKKTSPTRHTWMLIVHDGSSVLLEKRPPTGIWGGLWSLPEAGDEVALRARAQALGARGPLTALSPLTHVFTHFRLEIETRVVRCDAMVPDVVVQDVTQAQHDAGAWVALDQIDEYGLPAPVRRLIAALQGPLL